MKIRFLCVLISENVKQGLEGEKEHEKEKLFTKILIISSKSCNYTEEKKKKSLV